MFWTRRRKRFALFGLLLTVLLWGSIIVSNLGEVDLAGNTNLRRINIEAIGETGAKFTTAEAASRFDRLVSQMRPSWNPLTILKTKWDHRWKARPEGERFKGIHAEVCLTVAFYNASNTYAGEQHRYSQNDGIVFLETSKRSHVLVTDLTPQDIYKMFVDEPSTQED